MLFVAGVLCPIYIAYSVVYYLNVSLNMSKELITPVGGEKADYKYFCCFCSEEFPLPLGA